jgi:hypothetical protein
MTSTPEAAINACGALIVGSGGPSLSSGSGGCASVAPLERPIYRLPFGRFRQRRVSHHSRLAHRSIVAGFHSGPMPSS